MKKALLTVLLLVACASLASAAGINLNWGPECYGDAPQAALIWACNSNLYANTKPGAVGSNLIGMTISYALPYAKTNVVATEIDLLGFGNTTTTPVPEWWKLNDGECRGGVIFLSGVYGGSFGPLGSGGCFDYVQGSGMGVLVIDSSAPYRTHINGTWAVADPLGEIPAGQETYAATLKIKTDKSYGTGACAGCTTPWTWVVDYVRVSFQNEPTPLQLGTPLQENCLSWNRGIYECIPLPVRPTTWGRMKSLYR